MDTIEGERLVDVRYGTGDGHAAEEDPVLQGSIFAPPAEPVHHISPTQYD